MPVAAQDPKWVAARVAGVLDMLRHQFGWAEGITVEHVRNKDLLNHEMQATTPEHVENGAPIGVYLLRVNHPVGCACADVKESEGAT